MKKLELMSMLVSELKALAKKRKIGVPAGAKKTDIVKALLSAASTKKKAAAKKIIAKETSPKRTAAKKPAVKKAAKRRMTETQKKTTKPAKTRERKPVQPVVPVRDWKMPPSIEEPHLAQERIEESKYYTGPSPQPLATEQSGVPKEYGDDRLVLMTRDPFVVHAYWEVTPARLERERAWFGWGSKLCVRIYDITGVQFDGRNAIGYFDQELPERTGNWYFDLGRPNHSFCADLGLLSPEGRFLTLIRSNYVTMPPDGVSEEIDEEWMLADEEFLKLYGYPEGFRSGVSSPGRGLQEMVRRRRIHEITSPGLFPRGRVKAKRK